MATDNFIIPSDADKRIMLLLIGKPFAGKSTAAATFPKPLFLDFDHKAPRGFDTIPFWDGRFCDKFCKNPSPAHGPNQRDALRLFLSTHLRAYPNHTVILDSLTSVDRAFHYQTDKVDPPEIGRSGKADARATWRKKIDFYGEIFIMLKAHPGHVIVTVHEQPLTNEDGSPSMKIKPVITGQVGDIIGMFFTAVFRQIVDPRKNIPESEWYKWVTKPDVSFPFNNTFGMTEREVKADYSSLAKYFPVSNGQTETNNQ